LILSILLLACSQPAVQQPTQQVAQANSPDAPSDPPPLPGDPVVVPEPAIEEDIPSEVDKPDQETFIITGENFRFMMNGKEAPELKVKVGTKVRIEFTSTDGFHDWVVDEFGATQQVQTGDSTFVEFIADKTGTFQYYCSVGSHRAKGMIGNLVVE